jgi:glycosyltransferase involved in cell wall biosynthesis
VIYVTIVARNDTTTVGLALWKLRKVFQDFPREYQILVVDDASTDGTAETLETYQRALPMTLVRHDVHQGPAASLETLLRAALERSDRHKRDCVVVIPADFSVSPAVVPELVKRFESGADLVVAELGGAGRPWPLRLVARIAPWLLRPGVAVPGVRDLLSGTCAIRLVTLRNAMRPRPDRFFDAEGLAAGAELIARAGAEARQVATVRWTGARAPERARVGLGAALALAIRLFRAGRHVTVAPLSVETPEG